MRARGSLSDVQLEPVPGLEWSLATEAHPPTEQQAVSPAALRRSWIHTAAEDKVLDLYRELGGSSSQLPAPWWLRALDRGTLPSRQAAFDFEDQVHAVLRDRSGWVFVPWTEVGETGYWEYAPSDREPMKNPTTITLTDEHPGWLNVIPAYRDTQPLPMPLDGVSGLLAALPQIEAW
ncbi:hypothetical protein [Saccharopolyspora rectivirgula]|uniref:Uncharacterized protein n=1 Tax=Saccharopolyspora rectivirgula TaxID=28042 RepID=A0A073B2Z6_9PSEU|nr:hypothetical protein [Saccharopolyspora rectivirgula]KEI45990.1 hypothetical protein GU90_01005 [Saccharopolyspora rectivirgula]